MSESPSKSEEAMSKEDILRAEKEEEAKLKAKYPAVRPGPQLLQKRMQKGVSCRISISLRITRFVRSQTRQRASASIFLR